MTLPTVSLVRFLIFYTLSCVLPGGVNDILSQSLEAGAPVLLLMSADPRAGAEAAPTVLTHKVLGLTVHREHMTLQTIPAFES